ncbi:MAG: hypothetical protein ABIG31_04795 [Candidatus Omnitrophota bacterium]
MADNGHVIDRRRIRTIDGSFSWIDHRLITGGFLNELSTIEILLYFFLVSVSDRHGISFYRDDRICRILKIDLSGLGEAREGLKQRSLLAYKFPVYQVLALPQQPVPPPTAQELAEEKRKRALSYIQKLKQVVRPR